LCLDNTAQRFVPQAFAAPRGTGGIPSTSA